MKKFLTSLFEYINLYTNHFYKNQYFFKVIFPQLGKEVNENDSLQALDEIDGSLFLFCLSYLFLGLGCTTYKEAVADPVKVTPCSYDWVQASDSRGG